MPRQKDNPIPSTLGGFFGSETTEPELQSEEVTRFIKETLIESIIERFRLLLKHPISQSLSENPYLDSSHLNAYTNELAEYDDGQSAVDEYNQQHPGEEKILFIEANCNIGWKFHLNVAPQFVAEVSRYLQAHGYRHKFLHGGEIEAGKIFTVYIGDYNLSRRLAQKLSQVLRPYLSRPAAKGEVELAPGIVGRFVGTKHIKNEFHEYGTCGFSWKKEFQTELTELLIVKPADYEEKKTDLIKRAERESISALLDLYGQYFYDTANRL